MFLIQGQQTVRHGQENRQYTTKLFAAWWGPKPRAPFPVVEPDARVDGPLRVSQPQQRPHRILAQPHGLEHAAELGQLGRPLRETVHQLSQAVVLFQPAFRSDRMGAGTKNYARPVYAACPRYGPAGGGELSVPRFDDFPEQE